MDSHTPTLTLDQATLTPVVRRARGSDTVEVQAWVVKSLGEAHNQGTGGLYRVDGTGSDGGNPVRWSLVLKACRNPGTVNSEAAHANNYWKREFLTYTSGLLDDLPQGVRAPRCFGTEERPDGTAWLWLEDLTDSYGGPWPLGRYVLAARHAGQSNGAYLCGRRLPAVPWLGACAARSSVERYGPPLERLDEFRDHPLVRRQFPDVAMADRTVRLWRERELFLAAIARLPQTLCHLDLYKPNLFSVLGPEACEETVAVDWAFLGTAAVGEELAPLVCASVMLADADPDRVRELGETCFEGYLAGLRDAGWVSDARLARLGYAAGTIRYGLVPIAIVGAMDPEVVARLERVWRLPYEEIVDRTVVVQRYTLDLADEARSLMETAT